MMAAPMRTPTARAKTGIPVLDERLQGGFPRPSTLLLFSEKPTEKRIFGENFAVQGVKAGERSMYVDLLFLHNSTQAIAKFFQIVTSRAKANLGFILYAVHEGVHEPMTMNLLRSLVDGVVEMRYTDTMEREIRVHHMRGYRIDAAWHSFLQLPEAMVAP